MASIAAFVYFWSSAYEVSGCCTTDTLYPSFSRIFATASQPEPSANAPCTSTTFFIGWAVCASARRAVTENAIAAIATMLSSVVRSRSVGRWLKTAGCPLPQSSSYNSILFFVVTVFICFFSFLLRVYCCLPLGSSAFLQHFNFSLKPIAEVVTVTAPARQPDFVGSSLNLLMQL